MVKERRGLTIVLIVLVFVIIYQIAKASEHAAVLRGEEKVKSQTNTLGKWLRTKVARDVFGEDLAMEMG